MRARARPPLEDVAVAALCVSTVLLAIVLRLASGPFANPADLDVYLMGARALIDHRPVYEESVHGLFFTYPPFAAILFEPLTGLSLEAARWTFLGFSLVSYVAGMVVVGVKLRWKWWSIALLVVTGSAVEPFFRTVVLGQVNMPLMLLVVMDTLLIPRRHRGWFVGLAAGVKIVPGIFILFFLLQRDVKSACRATAAFLLTVAVGFVAAPGASQAFWMGGVAGLGRFGEEAVIGSDNQSLLAVIMRAFHISQPGAAVGLTACLIGVAVGAFVAATQIARHEDVAAVVALALGGLIASPISWTHHWVWVAPLLAVLVHRGWWWLAWVVGTTFVVAPMWSLGIGEHQELTFDAGQILVSASYLIVAVGALVRLFEARNSMPRKDPEPRSPEVVSSGAPGDAT